MSMATKSKAPAKSTAKTKAATKAGTRAATKAATKVTQKSAKTVERKAAVKPAAPKKAAKAAPKAVAAKAPAAKSRPAPAVAARNGARPGTRPEAAPAPATPVAGAVAAAPLPPPKPPIRPSQAVSPKELASAHEYLLIRSASRSGAPVIVDGKPLLTEEQLLSMPDSEYMNPEQLAFFRYQLQRIERELLSNADETTEHLRETVIVPDPADRATIEEEHALELRTRDRERKLLKKVQASLQQIESGEYGFCEETGDPIGIPRLLARPTATLSLEAQQRREIKQKLFGD
jgi:DnaK suppressor protein